MSIIHSRNLIKSTPTTDVTLSVVAPEVERYDNGYLLPSVTYVVFNTSYY